MANVKSLYLINLQSFCKYKIPAPSINPLADAHANVKYQQSPLNPLADQMQPAIPALTSYSTANVKSQHSPVNQLANPLKM